jgi:hypothetical protein
LFTAPGLLGGKPDALTRQSRDLPKEGDDCSLENQITIIKSKNILHVFAATSPDQPDILPTLRSPDTPTLSRLFREAYDIDPFPNKVLRMFKNGMKQCKDITLAECKEHDNLLLYR